MLGLGLDQTPMADVLTGSGFWEAAQGCETGLSPAGTEYLEFNYLSKEYIKYFIRMNQALLDP